MSTPQLRVKQRGDVRVNRIVHFRSKEPNKVHPKIEGYVNINVTSGNKRWKALSPMYLGPLIVEEPQVVLRDCPCGVHPGFIDIGDGMQRTTALNVEQYWQQSKIYNIDLTNGATDPFADDYNDVITTSFLERRAFMGQEVKSKRRAVPKSKGYPIASYFEGCLYTYLQARPYYIIAYETLVRQTPQYQELKRMLDEGTSIQIVGYDGQDCEITYEEMERRMYDNSHPFGHEFIVAGMLKNCTPWHDGWNPPDDRGAL